MEELPGSSDGIETSPERKSLVPFGQVAGIHSRPLAEDLGGSLASTAAPDNRLLVLKVVEGAWRLTLQTIVRLIMMTACMFLVLILVNALSLN